MKLLRIKPMSVNEAYMGRRYKTNEYRAYAKEVAANLPAMKIPAGNLHVNIIFSVSNSGADVDNPVKPFMDILQKKYGFNDKRVFKLTVEKVVVKKGNEAIWFKILPLFANQ